MAVGGRASRANGVSRGQRGAVAPTVGAAGEEGAKQPHQK